MTNSGGWIQRAAITGLHAYGRIAPTGRGSFHLAKAARRLWPREQWASSFALPWNVRLNLDLSTYPDCSMAFGLYEIETARWITRLLKPGGHFVDGGANLGYFTLLAARCVGALGRVDAFEPQPENLQRLLDHLQRNGPLPQVHVHESALADQAGEASIHVFAGPGLNHGCSSLFAGQGAAMTTSSVRTIRMDRALHGLHPDLIKLDIEGAEPLAIEGMAGLLTRQTSDRKLPALIIEYNPEQSAAAGFAPDEFLRRLLRLQPAYRIWKIGAWLSPLQLDDPAMKNLRQCNLLLRCP